MIPEGNNIDTSRTTQLAMGVTDNAIKAFTTRKIAATLLAPPYAEELEAKGYNKNLPKREPTRRSALLVS